MALIKHGNNALSSVTAFPTAVPTGKPVLLSTATASSSASIEFTSGIDSTYDIYQFEFVNINASTGYADFQFNLSTDNGSNYNVTKTSTFFRAAHGEDDASASVSYSTGSDLAQSTGYQYLAYDLGSDADQSTSGYLYIFAPSSSTYVKHWISRFNSSNVTPSSIDYYSAGYGNTTSAVDAIKFNISSGTFDGTIKMYGISA